MNAGPPELAMTVVVPTSDRPEGLRRCVEALLCGGARPREVVVVDQSRTGDTRVVAERLNALAGGIVYLHAPRRGLSAARNRGIPHATSPVIAFVDDDCVPSPGWAGAVAGAFAADPAPVVVTGPVLALGPETPGRFAVSSRPSLVTREFRGDVLPWEVGTGGNFAIRADRIGDRPLFDERLGTGSPGRAGEDLDVLRRLLRDGADARYCAEAVVGHERQSRRRRMTSRFGYGHGVGAACAVWARQGDAFAATVLARWTVMRLRRAGGAVVKRRDPWTLLEEGLVLAGTARGLLYGATVMDTRG